jgi:hypothetical protein
MVLGQKHGTNYLPYTFLLASKQMPVYSLYSFHRTFIPCFEYLSPKGFFNFQNFLSYLGSDPQCLLLTGLSPAGLYTLSWTHCLTPGVKALWSIATVIFDQFSDTAIIDLFLALYPLLTVQHLIHSH